MYHPEKVPTKTKTSSCTIHPDLAHSCQILIYYPAKNALSESCSVIIITEIKDKKMKYFTFDFTLCMFQVQPTLYQAYRTKIKKHTLLVKMATRAKQSLEKYLHFFCNTF